MKTPQQKTRDRMDRALNGNTARTASESPEEVSGTRQASHTPGPWRINRSKKKLDYPSRYINGKDGLVAEARAAGGPDRVAQSNARLIAAAPELLEALKRILADLEGGTGQVEPDILDADIFSAEAAINKAEGK